MTKKITPPKSRKTTKQTAHTKAANLPESNHKKRTKKGSRQLIYGTILFIILLGAVVAPIKSRYDHQREVNRVRIPKYGKIYMLNRFNWRVEDPKKAMTPAKEGDRYITVNSKILNSTTGDIWLSPVLQTYIKDSMDVRHGIELIANETAMQGGTIFTNTSVEGDLSYMVPSNDTGLTWCIEESFDSTICIPLTEFNKN